MVVVVSKCPGVVVKAAGTTPSGKIRLSAFDKVMVPTPVSLLLVFERWMGFGGDSAVETIKRGLSRALVYYYPFSGRLAVEEEVISCGGGGGVVVVGARASCTAADVVVLGSSPALRSELLPHYPEAMCREADPLLLMQVTELSCGGLVVGVTWNHVLADATGIGQFLQAVGEMSRGMDVPSPSVVPSAASRSAVLAAEYHGIVNREFYSRPLELTMDMAFLDMTIPLSLISRVKALCACTVFEAVAALLWLCRARATSNHDKDADGTATLLLSGNVRRAVLGASGSGGAYPGNCCVMESVQGPVAKMSDIKDVVELVRTLKKKINNNNNKPQEAQGMSPPAPPAPAGYSTLLVSSWRNLGLELVDFGGGTPARVAWYGAHIYMPFALICPPCKGHQNDGGVNVTGYICKKEHVDAFMHQIHTILLPAVSEPLNVA